MEKTVMTIMMMVIMLALVTQIMPTKRYTCPICGEAFYTYDELYSHFSNQHPAEPISIIWE